jgi:ADP-heptose:LPS heptosyltransferase
LLVKWAKENLIKNIPNMQIIAVIKNLENEKGIIIWIHTNNESEQVAPFLIKRNKHRVVSIWHSE